MLSLDPGNAGANTITAPTGSNNLIVGGSGANTITTGSSGSNVVIGANGQATFTAAGTLAAISSTNPTYASKNTINVAGAGNAVIGGSGPNVIGLVGTNSTIIGPNGQISFAASGSVTSAAVIDPSNFATNTITVTGTGNTIYTGSGSSALSITPSAGNTVIGDADDNSETADLASQQGSSPSDPTAAVESASDDETTAPAVGLEQIAAYSIGEIAAAWRTVMDGAFGSADSSGETGQVDKPLTATELVIRAIRDSEIVVKVGSGSDSVDVGAVWLFDEIEGALTARDADSLRIVIGGAQEGIQADGHSVAHQGSAAVHADSGDGGGSSWLGGLTRLGRDAVKAWLHS